MSTWIEVLKPGQFIVKNGQEVSFTEADLDAIAAAYDPAVSEAPLVFGHPRDNEPAYGWVTAFKRSGDRLKACVRQVPDAVKELVRNGHYKKVSLSLGPDRRTVRHVGLLGAVPPAVPGLADVAFSQGDGFLIELSTTTEEDAMTEALKQALEAERTKNALLERERDAAKNELSAHQQQAAAKDVEGRVQALIRENRILPADAEVVQAVALALGGAGMEIELSSGAGKKNAQQHLFDFLQGLPDRRMLAEFSAPAGGHEAGAGIGVDETLMQRV